jgi:hypothetical protein
MKTVFQTMLTRAVEDIFSEGCEVTFSPSYYARETYSVPV